jgi:hypothetical protein
MQGSGELGAGPSAQRSCCEVLRSPDRSSAIRAGSRQTGAEMMSLPRRVEPEFLELSADDSRAIHSRRDLRRSSAFVARRAATSLTATNAKL